MFTWTGMVDTDATNPANWQVTVSPPSPPPPPGTPGDPGEIGVTPPPPPSLPGAGDDVYFDAQAVYDFATGHSRDCIGLVSPTGSFASLHLPIGYTGTISLGAALTVNSFELASGAISQPTAGTDLTVTGAFTWTGGTLNSSANPATTHLVGATVSIDPSAGITTGDMLSFEDSAIAGTSATITAGTINLANGASLYLDTLSTLLTDTTNGNINFNQPAGQPAPALSVIDGTWTLGGGKTSTLTAQVVVSGELKITQSSTLNINAGAGNNASLGTTVGGQGIITIQNGSTLQVSNGVTIGVGGLIQTVANPDPNFNQADQRGTPAKIVGDLFLVGGVLTIDAGPNPHVWGKLDVAGNGTWTAGTMNVSIDPNAANNKMDQIKFSGTFTSTVTLGGNGQPVANSPAFNVIFSQQPAINQVWKPILSAGGGITENGPIPTANNGLTVVDETKMGGMVPGWDFQS